MKIILFFLVGLSQLRLIHAQQSSISVPKPDKTVLFSDGKKFFEDKFTFGADKLWVLPSKKEQGFAKIEQGVLKLACAQSELTSAYLKIPIEKVKGVSVSFLANIENCDFMAFAFSLSKGDEPFILRINNVGAVTLSRVDLKSSNKEERLPNTKPEKIGNFDAKKWYRMRVEIMNNELLVIVNENKIQHAKDVDGLTVDYNKIRFSAAAGKILLDEVKIETKS
jgi:hypothetical protein